MIRKPLFYSVLFFLLLNLNSYADSPLTSIDFWTIHTEDFTVRNAFRNQKMDKSTIDFILDENNSLEIRLSVINAIGWKFNSDNKKSTALLKSIFKKYKVRSIDNLFDVNHINILTCYTYSLALDNYKNVDNIIQLSNKVSNLDPNNFYSKYISVLIESQKYSLSFQWCNVDLVYRKLREDEYFKSDFGKKLYDITFDYIDAYDNDCPAGVFDYYIDLSNDIKFYELKKSYNIINIQIHPVLYRDGKIEIFSDIGDLIDSIPFVSADYAILDIAKYNYNQINIKFTDIDNQSISITLKK
ncbi:hypothetical protein [Flavobacterium sp. W22_SRS_FP1]|uniref:hypothetical protein n=1 Tax=Flavobacterium sp. W22_SRS_FP1 TaxID=3240276 RepID=UPI003F919DDF